MKQIKGQVILIDFLKNFIISLKVYYFVSKMKKKSILITWWLWYLWSVAVVELEKAGYQTVIVDNLSNSYKTVLERLENVLWYRPIFWQCDINDEDTFQRVFRNYEFETVFHFAGLKSVGESCKDPLFYFDNNISGTIKLLNLMNINWIKNIIFSSSATVYHPDNVVPFKEENITGPVNPYGTSKLIIENILYDLFKQKNFNVINLRYFNPIWAHPSGLLWEMPQWIPNNLLPYILDVVSGKREYLKVFWDDYDTKDWTWIRDYINVNDLIKWHVLALDYLEKKWTKNWFFQTFNLGTGKWTSVFEMLKIAEEVTNSVIPYKVVERREGDLVEVYCDITKAKEKLWFVSEKSVEESIAESRNFVKNNDIIE